MSTEETAQVISDNLAAPDSASVDGQSATAKSLKDQIAAAKYLRKLDAEAAAGETGAGRKVRFSRNLRPGTT